MGSHGEETVTASGGADANRTRPAARDSAQVFGVCFDLLFALLSALFMGGVLLDGRSHVHGAPETFFTPEHAMFYTAFLGIAGLLGVTVYQRRRGGADWRAAVPAGYQVSMLGIGLFFLGGFGDMLWHELFGIESNVEALLSPTHLTLFLGGLLFLTGPVRAAWRRRDATADRQGTLAMLTGWALLLAGFVFLTLYTHPFVRAFGARSGPVGHSHGESTGFLLQQLGVAGIMLQTLALLVVLGLLVHRFPTGLPLGWVTFLLGTVAGTTAVLGGPPVFVPAALAAGLVGDACYRLLDLTDTRNLRLFAAAVPAVLWAGHFVTVELVFGIGWAVHSWGGAILLGVFAGVVVSYLLEPPAGPTAP